jgi:hypothetical protein
MSLWLKKLVLAAALAVMPLQGVAAAMAALVCHGDAQVHAKHESTMHESGGHNHGTQNDVHNNDDGTTGYNAYHLCCHYTVTAPSAVMLPAALPDFPIRAFAPDPLHDLFIPDRPQRPPLA